MTTRYLMKNFRSYLNLTHSLEVTLLTSLLKCFLYRDTGCRDILATGIASVVAVVLVVPLEE